MRHKKDQTAARYRAAVFLLVIGCLLPSALPHGRMAIPGGVKALLKQTLREEKDPARRQFVTTACGLAEQVSYFWGGKSHAMGWDPAWGWPRRVTAPGNGTSGRIRRYGLDCSGLVSWAAATAWRDPNAYDQMGEGVRAQYANSIPTEDPRPGDLAFFPDLSHVGIILGQDGEGTLWVVHCSASRGGVVVTPAAVGFTLYGTPGLLAHPNRIRSSQASLCCLGRAGR